MTTLWLPLVGLLHILVGVLAPLRAEPMRHRRATATVVWCTVGVFVLAVSVKTASTTGWPR